MKNSVATEMRIWRESRKASLADRVQDSKPTPKEMLLEALTASGASITSFVLLDAQSGDLEGVAPDGIWAAYRNRVVKEA